MTKKEMFNAIMELENATTEIKDFCKHEIELLEKKSGSNKKLSANQIENEKIKSVITEVLTDANAMTCTEITNILNEDREVALHPNKVSALLSQLVKAEIVTKVTEKRVSRFSI